jgi:hypothetical protein
MNPIEIYLREMTEIRSSGGGTKETSYYGALERLFNEIGRTLKPNVRCVLTLANRGAGNPDGGLFTANQFQRKRDTEPISGQLPERGVIEIKPLKEDTWVTTGGDQVSRYWGKYGLILVTNYRDFVLIGKDPVGRPVKLESYRLAESEAGFWSLASRPRKAAEIHGTRFVEYLKRVMLHAAPLATPADVAWFLASYARDAKDRIEKEADLPALSSVREALEEALGLKFEGKKGEHFFRSSLIQTLFYGLFSAWVLWSKERSPADRSAKFDWKAAAWSLHVPMIRALFEQVASPGKLKPLGLVEPLEWAAAVLNRVDHLAFFTTFDQGQAVQYFYEPFLEQFDPELRKELGVWYTPPEIVRYMVSRVDTVLREEMEIEDGLADPRVYVLDPCCGTGTYLVEVLRRIAATLKEKGENGLIPQDLKRAARERVFGFEIMPAPFIVAHLQLGHLLQQMKAPLSHTSERVAVYLTNALTGWEPPKGAKVQLSFREMEDERDAAEEIKREKPILVILGNPPYNAFAGVSPQEEQGLVENYKKDLNTAVSAGGWGIRKFNLDDLYVRFFRLAERRIVEGKPGKGIVCYISNFSYLGDASFVVMRKRFLDEFDTLWFDNMNGDSRETGKRTPDGKPDPSVFSTEYHPVGIRVGTAIGLMARKAARAQAPVVRYREFWGVTKRADLIGSLGEAPFGKAYAEVQPAQENRFSFRPAKVVGHYMSWPKLVDLCAERPSNGLMEKRGGALIDIDHEKLEKRMQAYYDVNVEWDALKAMNVSLTADAARFEARNCRAKLLAAERFRPDRLRRYALRPFDHRWCYYSGIRPLWNEPRPSLWAQCWGGNAFLVSRVHAAKDPEGPPFYFATILSDDHLLAPDASCFPLRLKEARTKARERTNGQLFSLPAEPAGHVANLSPGARDYLGVLGIRNPDADAETAGLIWMHALAIGFSPAYLTENSNGIRQDWPRILLPHSKEALEASAQLGRQVAALLDTEFGVRGVTSESIRTAMRPISAISKVGGHSIHPEAGELDLTVGWGHFGKSNVVMPGRGKVEERDYMPEEHRAIEQGADALGVSVDQALEHLGRCTFDVYLNDAVYWRNVPSNVWGYFIGGYQVIKKWLSYRERDILGRSLTIEEAREVTNMARRISGILLMQPALDRNYLRVKENCFAWKRPAATPARVL